MSTRSTSYATAIEHLPAGAMLVIPGITWEEYERLLDELGDRPGVHLMAGQMQAIKAFRDGLRARRD